MHKILKRFLASVVLACFPLVFSACGGGGGDGAELTTVSGTAVKGPIKGALVQVFKLNSDGTKGELLGSGISGSDAKYAIPVPKEKAIAPLLVTVSGQTGATYASESKGSDVAFTEGESFNAVLDTYDANKQYTVSPLTDAAYQQLQKFLTDNPTSTADARIISAANARVATLFNVSDILADPASDPAYSASLKIIDQMIVNSGTATTLQTMSTINQGFADVNSLAYVKFRTNLETAATAVAVKEPSLLPLVNAIVAAVASPPVAPVLTDTTAPGVVSDFKAVAGAESATTSFVTLTWAAATTKGKNPVTGYDVYRDGVKTASTAATVFVDKPLVPSTTYRYYIVTFDAAGNRSLPGAEISATTPAVPNLNVTFTGQISAGILALPKNDITAPSAPVNLTATPSALNSTSSSVLLSWSASTDDTAVTGYDVYRDGIKISTVTQTGYTDPSVASNVTYVYSVKAFDAAGNRSAASSQVSVKPPSASLGVIVGGQVQPPL